MSKEPTTRELYDEIIHLRGMLTALSKGYPRPTTFLRNIGFFFLRGVVMGIGWITAFALLIPVLVMVLRFFASAPFVGDLIDVVIDRVVEYQRSVDIVP